MSLKDQITEDMKAAMKAKDAARLLTIRGLLAALKQKEVDERITLDDAAVVSIIDKLIKQRKDSIAQFGTAGRTDLVDKETAELQVLEGYLPERLSDGEVDAMSAEASAATGASGLSAMGKVMSAIKPKVAGRADMGTVSARIKAKLAG